MILLASTNISSETIRNKASARFDSINWTDNEDYIPQEELPAISIPGGDETFPVLDASAENGIMAIFPEIDQLGILDYTGIDGALLQVLNTLIAQITDKNLEATICNPERAFIVPLTNFRLARLPTAERAFMSRPQQYSENEFITKIRIEYTIEYEKKFLLIQAATIKKQDAWKINEIVFDGASYADITQQN